MGIIKLNLVVRAPIDELFVMAQDVETIPTYLPALKHIKIIERSQENGYMRAEWCAPTATNTAS